MAEEEAKVKRTPEPDKEVHQAAVKKIQDEIEEKQNRMVSRPPSSCCCCRGGCLLLAWEERRQRGRKRSGGGLGRYGQEAWKGKGVLLCSRLWGALVGRCSLCRGEAGKVMLGAAGAVVCAAETVDS